MQWLPRLVPAIAFLRPSASIVRTVRTRGITAAVSTAAVSTAAVSGDLLPRRSRESEARKLYAELNAAAFDGALPVDTSLVWNPRLRLTAGRCRFLTLGAPSGTQQRVAEIELSPRVLDSAERLRETLAHEMCHAAQWVLDGSERPPHGPAFQTWARRLEQRVPDLRVTTRHSYAVFCRHRYSCTQCGQQYGRHSRSINLRNRVCHACGGTLQYDGAVQRDGSIVDGGGVAARRKPKAFSPFASFVAEEYAPLRRRWPRVTHQRIMQELGRKWRRAKAKP